MLWQFIGLSRNANVMQEKQQRRLHCRQKLFKLSQSKAAVITAVNHYYFLFAAFSGNAKQLVLALAKYHLQQYFEKQFSPSFCQKVLEKTYIVSRLLT